MLKYGQEAKIESIYRIQMKCLYDNVEELGTDLDSTRIVQSEYSGAFYVMHGTSIDTTRIPFLPGISLSSQEMIRSSDEAVFNGWDTLKVWHAIAPEISQDQNQGGDQTIRLNCNRLTEPHETCRHPGPFRELNPNRSNVVTVQNSCLE
jgi:hypothetical protein